MHQSRRPILPVLLLAAVSVGCSSLVANMAGKALSGGGGGAIASDDDPELVGAAIPFFLKTTEGLLAGSPENRELLLSAAAGFTQYAYGFVQDEAERLEETNGERSRELLARARKLYARAFGYAMRGLEAERRGFRATFEADPKGAVARATREDVPFLYWAGASLAARIAISKDDFELVGRLGEVEALMNRALELDEAFGDGAIHEFFVVYDGGRSEAIGGSVVRAKTHYDRALELTKGRKLAPIVAWAEVVAVAAQDRKLFDEQLDRALAFDVDAEPRFRLANVLSQGRARRLKARAGDLFLEE